ncbi:MAG: hypothetical protein F9Y92_05690 [Thermoplasmatales archaeon]|nr:hypothetical protein [Thermoplasmatales archaeon]
MSQVEIAVEDLVRKAEEIMHMLPCRREKVYAARVAGVDTAIIYLSCWWSGDLVFVKVYRKRVGDQWVPVIGLSHYVLKDGTEGVYYAAIDVDRHCCHIEKELDYEGPVFKFVYRSRDGTVKSHWLLGPFDNAFDALKMIRKYSDPLHYKIAVRHFARAFKYNFAVLRVSPLEGERLIRYYYSEEDPMARLHAYLRIALGWRYE